MFLSYAPAPNTDCAANGLWYAAQLVIDRMFIAVAAAIDLISSHPILVI